MELFSIRIQRTFQLVSTKPGRTPGIGNMLFAGKMETAQAGMPSDQPIGLLLRWISTDGEPTIGVYGVSVWGCPVCSRSKEWRNGKGKKAGRCLVCKAAR